jgi:hypothetical protein
LIKNEENNLIYNKNIIIRMEDMPRKEMCDMLCNMGYDMNELEMYSDAELMQMCGGNMNHDMMDNDNHMHENVYIKSWKNFK